MRYKNWDDFKLPCSGIGDLMTRPKNVRPPSENELKKEAKILAENSKKEKDLEFIEHLTLKRLKFFDSPLSETAKNYLVDRYAIEKYQTKHIGLNNQSNAILKGRRMEAEGIEIVSFVDKIKYETPSEYVENEYLIGICDAISPDKKKIIDVKTSWNASNFMSNRLDQRLPTKYWMQMQGYLNLYNVPLGQVCFVLTNTPPHLVEQERILLFKKYTFGEITRDKFDENMSKFDSIFDYKKIPLTKRIIRFEVPKCDEFIPRLHSKISKARDFLNEFERDFLTNKKIVSLAEHYLKLDVEEDFIEYNSSKSL